MNSKHWGCLIAAFLWVLPAPSAKAQDIELGDGVTRFPNQALATFGLVAIPNESASAISLKRSGADETSFLAGQIGGGFRVNPDTPIYLEGYLGFQRYDPTLVLKNPSADMIIPVQWSGASATGGIGYDFKLTDYWSLRPIVNFSIGHIVSDASILGAVLGSDLDIDTKFLVDGGMSTGGYGGSLLLTYEKKSSAADLDIRIRYSHLQLLSILGDADLNARAKAISTSVWARARIPIGGLRWQGRPVRSVWEASLTDYSGDQGKVLDIDWLARVGTGLELDVSGSNLTLISRARVGLHYVFGEDIQGLSLGLGVSF